MKQVTLTKGYQIVVSQNYQSYRFSAELTETYEVKDDQELQEKARELFQKVFQMVKADYESVFGGVECQQ